MGLSLDREPRKKRANPKESFGSAIAPVERETLNDRVYHELRSAIMAGSFKPGAELTLRSVADALGTSLMPVRDAIRRLVSERALEMRPSRKVALPVLSIQQFLELRRVRVLLEGEAAALAAEKISPRQLSACRNLLAQLQALDEDRRGQFWKLNHKLHFAIYEAAESPLLMSIIETLWLQIGPLLTRIATARAVSDSADAHALLVDALERRDPAGARRALELDLTQSTERVMQELASQKALRA